MVVGVLWWCGEKGPRSVLFPSRHAPRKIRICEEQGSKGRLDSSPCQVVLAQYPWGLKSHDPFAWNIVLLLLILCRWIHNCIHVSEIWQPICLKNCGVVVLAHTSQMDSDLYPCFWNLTIVSWGLKSDYPFAWNIVLLLSLIICRWIHNYIHVLELESTMVSMISRSIHNWIHNTWHDTFGSSKSLLSMLCSSTVLGDTIFLQDDDATRPRRILVAISLCLSILIVSNSQSARCWKNSCASILTVFLYRCC